MSGWSTITRHSDSLRGERHCARTVVLHSVSLSESVQTRGRRRSSIGGSPAPSPSAEAVPDRSKAHASAISKYFECEARKRSHHVAIGHDGTVGDRVAQMLVM